MLIRILSSNSQTINIFSTFLVPYMFGFQFCIFRGLFLFQLTFYSPGDQLLSQQRKNCQALSSILVFFFPQEEELSKDTNDRMVWTPEYLAKNAFVRINMYKDNMLRPLEVSCPDLDLSSKSPTTDTPKMQFVVLFKKILNKNS